MGELISHRRWPFTTLCLAGGEVLAAITAFLRDQPLEYAVAKLQCGVPKAAYTAKTRVLRGDHRRPPKHLRLSGEEVAREINIEECCL